MLQSDLIPHTHELLQFNLPTVTELKYFHLPVHNLSYQLLLAETVYHAVFIALVLAPGNASHRVSIVCLRVLAKDILCLHRLHLLVLFSARIEIFV